MNSPVDSWEESQGVVYLDSLEVPQRAVQGVPRVVAGIDLDTLPLCAAGCGKRMLRRALFRSLPKEQQKELRSQQVRRVEAKGICGGCYPKVIGSPYFQEIAVQAVNAPIHERVDIPPIWESVLQNKGGYPELAAELGVSAEYARQLVVKLGLPQAYVRRRDSDEREYFIEELERFASFGVGVHEIARAFSMTEDALVAKVKSYRERKLTKVQFEHYHFGERIAA